MYYVKICKGIKSFAATNGNFIILLSLQPDDVNLRYLKLKSNRIQSLKYLRSTTLVCKYRTRI